MSEGALPTFIVIGAAKCGTTSLHQYLSLHPEIWMSRTKEVRFFQAQSDTSVYSAPLDPQLEAALARARHWSRGLDWYRSQFDPRYEVRGESSPGYTSPHYPGCAERIASVVPEARLIYCVRDPVERALSSYRFRRAGGTERRPPHEALRPGSFYSLTGCYARCLEPFLERIPRERVLIVEAERLDRERREELRRVFAFLGVDEGFTSPEFERRWNVTATQRGLRWHAISWLREQGWWDRLARRVPRRALWLAERATTTAPADAGGGDAEPALPGDFVAELSEDAARFRAMVGLDLAGWRV